MGGLYFNFSVAGFRNSTYEKPPLVGRLVAGWWRGASAGAGQHPLDRADDTDNQEPYPAKSRYAMSAMNVMKAAPPPMNAIAFAV